MIRDGVVYHYLPKRVRACPQCHKTAHVQIIVYGMPAVWPTPEEEDRVKFAGCEMYSGEEEPRWYCPACEVAYTAEGVVVPEPEDW